MPRDLPLGNGSLLINFDKIYQLRDLYFPHVGNENHTGGHVFHFGVWVNGNFRWIDDPKWRREIAYETDTLVSDVTLTHPDLPVALHCHDAVDFHENVYIRHVRAENLGDLSLDVRLFFHHDFHIYENDVGDTAYYEPRRKVVFHYKDLRWFLINTYRGPADHGVDQFACGQKEINGLQGTWKDAEDGSLSGSPVAQGSVDSTIGAHLQVAPRGTAEMYYWLVAGESFEQVTRINHLVVERGPATLVDRTEHYWSFWLRRIERRFKDLPPDLGAIVARSLLIIRTQIDDGGGILAANDFDITSFARDTYSYVWPRDGALVANALIESGFSVVSRSFFNFCGRILTKEGFFLHKYNPDGSLASSWHPWMVNGQQQLPIQEDETGLVLWALGKYFAHFPEVDFIKPLYRDFIIRAADFLEGYRDPRTGLPRPSWDLWEERHGVLSWTVAAVYAGLSAAAGFADAFGEHDHAARYRKAAAEIKAGADTHLWDEQAGRFLRMITPQDEGASVPDMTIDASIVGLFLFGMYPADDPRIVQTMEITRDRLWVKTDVGGMARYENDYYHQVTQDTKNVPGNPWFICTLWLARWIIAKAKTKEEMAPALDLVNWVAKRALPSGVLAEQVHPFTDEPLSVLPLTWSHAEVVSTVVEYLDKLAELQRCPTCGQSVVSFA
ncbi:MAG TPA: glycoside hydrolase family 15 protein [Chloroflexota bacterium]|nr:glycoside hydrolase family 15 protein [Chloroflexota bacterium]